MRYNNYDPYDKRLKDGMEALAADVSIPDVAKAFERHKRRRSYKNRVRGVVAAAAVFLMLVTAVGGSVNAFRGFIKVTITRVISETSQLFQRSDEGSIGVIDTLEVKQFDSLSELQQEKAASMLLPSGLDDETFVFAEVVYDEADIKRLVIEILHDSQLLRYRVINTDTTARFIDIEDFSAESKTVNGRDVAVFSDDQGFVMLEWDSGRYTFTFSGDMLAEELLEIGILLRML